MDVRGAPPYLAREGVPRSLAALATHRCSAFRHPGTAKVLPWRVNLDGQTLEQPVVPAMCSKHELFELQAVLTSKALGRLAGGLAAPYIRSGQLQPIPFDQIPDISNYFAYFGNQTSQEARGRAFIDVALQRLAENPEYVHKDAELRLRAVQA